MRQGHVNHILVTSHIRLGQFVIVHLHVHGIGGQVGMQIGILRHKSAHTVNIGL